MKFILSMVCFIVLQACASANHAEFNQVEDNDGKYTSDVDVNGKRFILFEIEADYGQSYAKKLFDKRAEKVCNSDDFQVLYYEVIDGSKGEGMMALVGGVFVSTPGSPTFIVAARFECGVAENRDSKD